MCIVKAGDNDTNMHLQSVNIYNQQQDMKKN